MKVWYYTVINVGLLIFLQLAGIDTGNSWLLNTVGVQYQNGTITNVNTSAASFFGALFGTTGAGFSSNGLLMLLAGAAVGAIIAGLYKQSSAENLILLPLITGTLAMFVAGMVNIAQYILGLGVGWVTALVVLILVPYIIGYILALAEFFRGSD